MPKTEPKSYLPPEEREALLREGDMDALYLAESLKAGDAGDEDTAWAWLAMGKGPAEALLVLKWNVGADFIREKGFDTELADKEYWEGWLDKEMYTETPMLRELWSK